MGQGRAGGVGGDMQENGRVSPLFSYRDVCVCRFTEIRDGLGNNRAI